MPNHRNFAAGHFCPTCEHQHSKGDDATLGGLCLKGPPTAFLIGMAPNPLVINPKDPAHMMPIIRAYYPTVGSQDTCSQYEPRAQGTS